MLPIMTSAIESPEDQDIMTEFFVKHKMLLYNEAWKYLSLQEDVEDIVFETLTRIIANMDKFRAMELPQRIQYGKVIVRNLSFIHLRRSAYFTMVPFEDVDVYLPIGENEMPDNVVMGKLQREQIRGVWAQMPAEERLLLEQKYILEWTDKELASRLGIQPQSVRMRLTRARRRVMELMKKQGVHFSEWI